MQKMFLVSPHQLNHLPQLDYLDTRMRTILNEPGLNPYEKIKKYNALLQLTLVKQDKMDELRVTLTLYPDPLTDNPKAELELHKVIGCC